MLALGVCILTLSCFQIFRRTRQCFEKPLKTLAALLCREIHGHCVGHLSFGRQTHAHCVGNGAFHGGHHQAINLHLVLLMRSLANHPTSRPSDSSGRNRVWNFTSNVFMTVGAPSSIFQCRHFRILRLTEDGPRWSLKVVLIFEPRGPVLRSSARLLLRTPGRAYPGMSLLGAGLGGEHDLDIETSIPPHTAQCCDCRRSSWKVP